MPIVARERALAKVGRGGGDCRWQGEAVEWRRRVGVGMKCRRDGGGH